jgi:hypothetical protein
MCARYSVLHTVYNLYSVYSSMTVHFQRRLPDGGCLLLNAPTQL